ncbi:OmpH family outer membrane protein [Congregibacter brevis]|uniref:OmpH family outer membrane protein n=1 Tax=Congregibacter brevis TaxID=3081201 RepID=A0ABZ0IAJ1_9GAMM|nr:OmpH family outer membrane protein [Congregibacter sp. IMCC45268]
MIKKFLAVVALGVAMLPMGAFAQGKVAVVDLQAAILQSDAAQQRLENVRGEEGYKADKEEFDRLREELDKLVREFQKDAAVMSQEQQVAARKRLASKQADLEHVGGKLQQAEQATGQALLQEMSPMVQEVLSELITTEGIGLLLQRTSVIHADPGYSITAKVTDKLNQLSAAN